jgi:two-component system response regulator BaeR
VHIPEGAAAVSARVLIVEDEVTIAELLRDYFLHAGFRADILHRGDKVEAELARNPADLVVLDLQLPGKDGLAVCQGIRSRGDRPAIMMVTARVDEIDRLIGLELGADDYICKPFSPREVVARAKTVLRRLSPQAGSAGTITIGGLQLDHTAHRVTARGIALTLTRIEFEILAAMMEQPSRVWSRAQLLERARGTDLSAYERNIDGHVKNLRQKLKAHFPDVSPIRSVYGVGYGLESSVLG